MIKAVFWDSDNTIFENSTLHWRKHVETLAPMGIILGPQDEQRFYENNGSQNWHFLASECGLSMSEQDYLALIDAWYEAHVKEIDFRSGVLTLIHAFDRQRILQAVVSNGRRNSVMKPYENKGIEHFFKFFITIEDCEHRKPSPDPYLKALQRLGDPTILASDCLVIEDDAKGVEAAHHAGMPVIQRKRNLKDTASPFATLSVFEEKDFLEAVSRFLN